MHSLTHDNKIVHGMWVGSELSRLELLTLHSFTHFGHDFHLWVYDLKSTPLPIGVSLRDASEIIPREKVFKKVDYDPETGVGRESYGAPFSDLFRYKLLYEHGGIWVDMDVTCLQPFNFVEEYVFRPHRIGVMGNILKCPKGSRLMKDSYEETAATVNEQSEWLAPNRILNKNVERLELGRFSKPDICNADSWLHIIRHFVEKYAPIPDQWYAIHWINEFWRTLETDRGYYRGRRILDYIPDKDHPAPGSTLYELYRKYHLIGPWQDSASAKVAEATTPDSPVGRQGTRTPITITNTDSGYKTPTHFNVLIPSMVRGGAERTVLEMSGALRKLGGVTQTVYLLHKSQLQYPIEGAENANVVFVEGDKDANRMRSIALKVLQSPVPVLYTHLLRSQYLRHLWSMGVVTIPVVQNSRPSWLDAPTAYNHPRVPFVVAVSDAVADQLRESGCEKPVVTIRHEVQRWFKPEELARNRKEIRDRHGIRDDTLLIGMVGQFKAQKAYTRAVRVLHSIRQLYQAKLMILGGWDHEFGSGRTAYEAACRQAVDLGVVADMITPGDVHPVEPYLAAFDVFLNTSVYEGLSVSLLEAIQTGCPIVTADAGGNSEVLPPNSVLVKDSSNIAAYVEGIRQVANYRERILPPLSSETSLIPRLWCLLAKHGITGSYPQRTTPAGTLFVTEDLHVGGPQRSLVNLLCRLPANQKTFLCVLGGIPATSYGDALEHSQVPILATSGVSGTLDKVEGILGWADKLNVRNICFWNAHPEVKLALAKILSVRNIRLFDVSPGPMLFDELDSASLFQRRICMNAEQYFRRLDCFVAKYSEGVPPESLCDDHGKIAIIPNGVPLPPRFVPLPPARAMLPRHFNPDFAIGTCCRIVPEKRLEFVIDMMKILSARVPHASLTIVGGPDNRSVDYWNSLLAKAKETGLDNILFVGRHEDVNPFLGCFKVFVMAADWHGCSNASLEAMAMKLPVVANRCGDIGEQIEDGVNGYLISDPAEMAHRVELLLTNDEMRRAFGEAGYKIVRERFSMEKMVDYYSKGLDGKFITSVMGGNGHPANEGRSWYGPHGGQASSGPRPLR